MTIQKIYNGNVYVGQNSLLGKAKEIELPTVTTVEDEHQALGMFGKLSFAAGLELLEATISWAGFYPEVLEKSLDPFTYQKLQIRASIDAYDPTGRTSQTPLVCLMTARWKEVPILGTLGAQAATETSDSLAVNYLKLTVGGDELLELDVPNNIWRVKGVDVLQTYRTNLGI